MPGGRVTEGGVSEEQPGGVGYVCVRICVLKCVNVYVCECIVCECV